MHVLLIHQAFASIDEGGGTRHFELARYLIRQGYQFTIITSPISYLTGKTTGSSHKWIERQHPIEGMTIITCYTYPALHKSFFHRLINFISFMVSSTLAGLGVDHVDLVWGTSPPIFQGVTAWFLARLKRVPFLFEVRDLWPEFAISVGVLKNNLIIRASEWLERFLYSHADHVMVNSPGYIDHVKQHGAKQVSLLPNGADPDMFPQDNNGEHFRQRYQLEQKFLVSYAGAHGVSNDLGIVLETANLLRQFDDIQFIFMGDGKDKPALQQQAQEMQLNNVTFLPTLPKMEMAEALAASNACIAILKPIESFTKTYPNKVFDYMAAGRPVILAIDGVIRKVVEDANAGIPVSPGSAKELAEAVKYLSSNPERAWQMGASGREYLIKNFNRQDLANQLAGILEMMLRRKL
jgi:glycosyltransferase involved in cell wall biosynthesis